MYFAEIFQYFQENLRNLSFTSVEIQWFRYATWHGVSIQFS